MNMRIATLYVVWLLCATQHAFPSETNTNTDTVSPATMKKIDAWMTEQPNSKWTLYRWIEYKTPENELENFEQRFGVLTKILSTKAILAKEPRAGQDWVQSRGERWFTDTSVDTLMDAFTAWFDFDRLKRSDNSTTVFFAKFAQGSLSPDEGKLHPDSVSPEGALSLYNWINSFVRHDRTRYGANLINDKPYLFYSWAAWENGNGQPFVISDTRVRLDPIEAALRVDENLLFPIDDNTQVLVGLRVYPTEFDHEGLRPSLVIKISHQLERGSKDQNVVYASLEINEREHLFFFVEVSLNDLFRHRH